MSLTMTFTAESAADLRGQILAAAAEYDAEAPTPVAEEQLKSRKGRGKAQAEEAPEKPAEPVEPAEAPAPEVTMEDLREEITKLVSLGEAGSKASVQIVASLGAINEKGLPHIKALKPEKFAECLAAVKAKIEELTPKGVL
jgi:hypothetical protein